MSVLAPGNSVILPECEAPEHIDSAIPDVTLFRHPIKGAGRGNP